MTLNAVARLHGSLHFFTAHPIIMYTRVYLRAYIYVYNLQYTSTRVFYCLLFSCELKTGVRIVTAE